VPHGFRLERQLCERVRDDPEVLTLLRTVGNVEDTLYVRLRSMLHLGCAVERDLQPDRLVDVVLCPGLSWVSDDLNYRQRGLPPAHAKADLRGRSR
jgi:hypothetical protein